MQTIMADLNFNNLSQAAREALLDATFKEVTNSSDLVASGTPVNAVKATQTLTSDATAPSDGDTVTIGSTVYTFKTELTTDPATVAYEVLIGVSAAVALDNLKSAINATAGAGTVYGTGTAAHPTVSATTNTNTTQVVEALTAGTAAHSIVTTENSTHLSWGDTELAGGVDGTVGGSGAILFDSDNIYIATAENTVAGANWKKAALAALS